MPSIKDTVFNDCSFPHPSVFPACFSVQDTWCTLVFNLSNILFNWLWPCGLLPGPALILDQSWHHLWCSLLAESKLLELPTLLCKPMLKMSLLSRWSEIPMEPPICLCLGRDDQAQISRGSWRSCILTGCSAWTASAALTPEMATTAQSCSCRHIFVH